MGGSPIRARGPASFGGTHPVRGKGNIAGIPSFPRNLGIILIFRAGLGVPVVVTTFAGQTFGPVNPVLEASAVGHRYPGGRPMRPAPSIHHSQMHTFFEVGAPPCGMATAPKSQKHYCFGEIGTESRSIRSLEPRHAAAWVNQLKAVAAGHFGHRPEPITALHIHQQGIPRRNPIAASSRRASRGHRT